MKVSKVKIKMAGNAADTRELKRELIFPLSKNSVLFRSLKGKGNSGCYLGRIVEGILFHHKQKAKIKRSKLSESKPQQTFDENIPRPLSAG